jgi:peptidoglycan hydrolase-like protein with peptidoglycan-binding domain
MPVLQEGSRGPEVEALQKALVAQGYFVGAIDGVYGLRTVAAVVYFQSVNNLTIDGMAGSQTLQLLGIGDSPGSVEMTLPAPDAVKGDKYAITLHASVTTPVRVVVWFTAGSKQEHTEESTTVNAGAAGSVTVNVPTGITEHEGEVHVHAYAFPQSGTEPLDQKASSFWVNK